MASRSHVLEGGNRVAALAIPLALGMAITFYPSLAAVLSPYNIDVQVVFSYVFNLFALGLGALVSLFALLACKPTAFLERIKSTQTFAAVMSNVVVAMIIVAVVLGMTFVLGAFKLEPAPTLTGASLFFLAWSGLAIGATIVYVRTIRLIFIALA